MGMAGRIHLQEAGASRAVGLWLLACAGMVFVMVVLGGVTRLTGSGLSMVEWQPLTLLPPLTEAAWQAEFARYQASPQYQLVNRFMTPADFKAIFWLEYAHRLWGRLIGAAVAGPLAGFLLAGRIGWRLAGRLLGLLVLGAAQGALGWYMVASGLIDRPEVSHYRLTAHLGLGVLLYGALLWLGLTLLGRPPRDPDPEAARALYRRLWLVLALTVLTMLAGALVAGLDAGLIYNTFPLMDGRLVPPDYDLGQPFDNIAAVQFHHRVLALASVAAALAAWGMAWRRGLSGRARIALTLLPLAALAQMGLGIATLILAVPAYLAAFHQAGALVLVSILIWALRETSWQGEA